jgi:large subunit ribosomal protein L15
MSEEAAEKPAARKASAKSGGGKSGTAKAATAKSATAKSATAKTTAEKTAAGKASSKTAAAGKSATGKSATAKTGSGKSAAAGKAASGKATATGKSAARATRAKQPAEGESAAAGDNRVRALRTHHLRPAPGAHRDRIRKGRGEASKGKTSGRGTKGTKARDTVKPGFEGGQMPLIRRLPKLKGFSNPFREEYQVVNLSRLTDLYPGGGEVTPEDLATRGAVRPGRPVKILGTGEVSAALRVKAHAFSASAKEKIAAAGGATEKI